MKTTETTSPTPSSPVTRTGFGRLLTMVAALLFTAGQACSPMERMPEFVPPEPIQPFEELSAPDPDPRVGLGGGLFDAEETIWNLNLLSTTPPPEDFLGSFNSDLAFYENYAIQGNYNGYIIWDISDPGDPQLVVDFLCPASQSDVSIYGDLLFVSGEGLEGRLDCGPQGVAEQVSDERLRGIRIFDLSNVQEPDYIANVQTCRGSHTHSVLDDPNDNENVYIYVSGSAPVRPDEELPGCISEMPEDDPETALFRIEIIQVPLANPQQARIVSSPRIFEGLEEPPRHDEVSMVPRGELGQRGPNQCHDITIYPQIGMAAGACEGYGLLLDITDPVNPVRIDAVTDENFAYWHSATFNRQGNKVLFTDEWGGGVQPKCREEDPYEWGANAIYEINEENRMEFRSYYKLPAPQTEHENCVAHNGSLIPVPGRDIMVQAWYQGGVSVFDWSDASNPIEIAYHDRGPVDTTRVQVAGSWSAYWYNGAIVSSEIARGLDVFELEPSEYLTENEIAAANTVLFAELNVQGQPGYDWPATFVLARAYMDQLERERSLLRDDVNELRRTLLRAEYSGDEEQSQLLLSLAYRVDRHADDTDTHNKFYKLGEVLRELADGGEDLVSR